MYLLKEIFVHMDTLLIIYFYNLQLLFYNRLIVKYFSEVLIINKTQ